ncbi:MULTISPECIES: cyclic pyranopterin monophosphate synthase MoaC [Clostridium]|uniref:Cyclic pyranopterin monophosphate synthase n=1 Tax=Clostridium cibarium TaxID=2762247 RepID=A0ABR8PNY3_9CLOT|nr:MULTISPECIES: cyclic pyranopterin monophosphate synthase MoaC [Clostridium]MBD7909890.1 cyclic pyranopterin monophosphate synthase MoaC [Clostridium cibarium]
MENKFSHFDLDGNAVMVDISEKNITSRTAIAKGKIFVNGSVMESILNKTVKKGDVLGVARIAGIMGVKKTSELIPMCHPLMISKCKVDFQVNKEQSYIEAICTVKVEGKTGVEMEALTGVNITLLTIYDMCKAIDKTMEISEIYLEKKTGGKSGEFLNEKQR